jgi:hypothetical protein
VEERRFSAAKKARGWSRPSRPGRKKHQESSASAGLLLTAGTKVATYDGQEKIDQWIAALA